MNKIQLAIQLVEEGEAERGLELLDNSTEEWNDEEKFEIAGLYFHWGFIQKAKTIVEALLLEYPGDGELSIFLAELLIELDEEEEAISILDQISPGDPGYVEALLLLADLYQVQGLDEVSEHKLLTAKKERPEEPVIDFALGELYAGSGEFLKSIPYYEKVLEEATEMAGVNIHSRLAESLSGAGRFEESLVHFEKALDDKEEINPLFNFGFTAYQAGHYKKAIELFTRLRELDPEYTALYLYLAKAYEHEEELAQSLETVKQGLKADELNKEMHLYAGKIALKLGDEAEAEEQLRSAVAIDPGYIEAVLTLTSLLRKNERYEDMEECLDEVMKYGEYDPQFEWDLATSKNKLEQFSDALNHYKLAYTSFKEDPNFLEEYGYFLLEEGDVHEAKEVLHQLLKIVPSHLEAEELLARLED